MKTKGLNILVATPHFPYPLVGGERIKLYHLVRHLAANNKVHIVSLDRGYPVESEFIDKITELGALPHVFRINDVAATVRSGFSTLFRYPLEVEYFNVRRFRNKIEEISQSEKIDLSISFFARVAEHIRGLSSKKILVAEDCRSLYQQRTARESTNLRQKLIRGIEASRIAKYESMIMNHFDRTTVVTQKDYDEMHRLNPDAAIRIVSQGIDLETFSSSIEFSGRKGILFLGKLDVWANILMVKRIVNSIFPMIKRERPDAKLLIAGANPGSEILGSASDSIQILPNPDRIETLYGAAAVFLHPHMGCSGIQNKVLESMASGCPVVTSESGANGIDIVNGENGFIARTDDEFAKYTIQLLDSLQQRQHVGAAARSYVERNCSWKSIFNQWDEMVEEL